MNILKSKHMILAMFVAPVLAIIGYFSVDYIVSEKPQAAQQGSTYKLAAKSNCRYQSGACTLRNGDIEVHIRALRIDAETVELTMHSELPVQQAILSYVSDDFQSAPAQMSMTSAETNDRHIVLHLGDPEKSKLRFALNISGVMYYAETTAVFVDYETSFSRDNFSEQATEHIR
jgi:hypothetical protein